MRWPWSRPRVEWLGELCKLSVGEDDILVLSIDKVLTVAQAEQLRIAMCVAFPDHKVVVLEQARLGVLEVHR